MEVVSPGEHVCGAGLLRAVGPAVDVIRVTGSLRRHCPSATLKQVVLALDQIAIWPKHRDGRERLWQRWRGLHSRG